MPSWQPYLITYEWMQCFPHIDFILTAAQVYLVTHFCFYYYYYRLHFFLSARDNETIRDRITSGKSPLVLCVSYCSFCELKNRRHSLSVSHTLIYLWRAATISTTHCHQLPRLTHTSATLAQYLATFRPFCWLFPHNRYILTNLAIFFKKP